MTKQHVIIFDGVCNFCNGAVNFIIKRDKNNSFVFAPMQSPTAQELIAQYGIENIVGDSFILIKNGHCYLRTDAALEVTKDLAGFWYLFRAFKLLPTAFRDYFYQMIAKNRYRFFGKKSHCVLPSDEEKSKFLW